MLVAGSERRIVGNHDPGNECVKVVDAKSALPPIRGNRRGNRGRAGIESKNLSVENIIENAVEQPLQSLSSCATRHPFDTRLHFGFTISETTLLSITIMLGT